MCVFLTRFRRAPAIKQKSLQQQTATADVLKVISRSVFDLQPVLETLVESAARLCEADNAFVYQRDAGVFRLAATYGFSADYEAFMKQQPVQPGRGTLIGRTTLEASIVHIPDALADPEYSWQEFQTRGGYRTMLGVPMLREGFPIGVFAMTRSTVKPFTDKQLSLLQTFADQAVIAIENVRLFNETREALERQTATADILKVIASSPSDVQPVFNSIASSANRLLGGFSSTVFLFSDGMAHLKAFTPTTRDADEVLTSAFPRPVTDVAPFQMTEAGEAVQIPDTEAPTYQLGEIARARGYRSMLFTPLMNKGTSIGFIAVTRVQTGTFADHHVQLLKTFADQAVIAIENVRLFDEVQAKTRDLEVSLQQQTATADVLKVIASSPTDVGPALGAIAESACGLCEANDALVMLKDGDDLVFKAQHGSIPVIWERRPINRRWLSGCTMIDRKPFHVHDIFSPEGEGFDEAREISRRTSVRTVLSVPLLRESASIGVISLRRTNVQPFSDKQIALLQTFADQAVIAIENARLFSETQEALERQTATAEVLQVISSSPGELEPVFQAMLEKATRICDARFGTLFRFNGSAFYLAAEVGTPPKLAEVLTRHGPFQPSPGGIVERVLRTKQVNHTADYAADTAPGLAARFGGARSTLGVPMLKDDILVGVIVIYRQEARPFTDKQIGLVQNFAAQAVIAIENTRLLHELRERTDDLSESLQQQTATSEVLETISSSAGELKPVFDKMLENATRICGARFGTMTLNEEGGFRTVALYNAPKAYASTQLYKVIRPHPESGLSAVEKTHQTVHIDDIRKQPPYIEGNPNVRALADLAGARTLVIVPMLKEDELIGSITIFRQEVKPFTNKQTELVANFANQAVIAIENARLLNELRKRTEELSQSLDDLRTTQDRLIQTEKLASLGQLTAGIAHEIKNPLNFVNNFSALSAELVGELDETLAPVALDQKTRLDVGELTQMLKSNLEKVVQHGKRANSIVKNMLLHSREGSGEHRSADINALVEESLNLAYHGARAEKSGFKITLKHDLDPEAGAVELYPQEITRALLNLISNGFYAATKRKSEAADETFEPVLTAATKNLGKSVEIRIRDNGTGIPPEAKKKMFNPFFTTKPAGEGTGLGLSMSHDIIVKQHGGRIDVETEPGVFTEFIITLPRYGAKQI